jgi:endonuclease/exonuclease/phosphatase family metal-dependent hydrolase
MIGHLDLLIRRARRALSRSAWSARLLGLAHADAAEPRPGLVMVQIDGLSRAQAERALEAGRMPFLRHLIRDEGYRLSRVYTGMPSTTPAVQGELFYGVRNAVPGFSFVDRASGRVVKMWEREPAAELERLLGAAGGLLESGSAYCDIYTGGAADARFCMAGLGWSDLIRARRPLALPVLATLHAFSVVRTVAWAALELVLACGGFLRGVLSGQDLWTELRFIPTRVGICIVLREVLLIGSKLDVARGVPIVHLNLLGYDEQAHRRGPSSRFAHWSLKGIDRTIARLTRAARRSTRRAYDVWVYSDHGQEETLSYVEHYGRSVHEAIADVFRAHSIEAQPAREPLHGVQTQRARLLGETLFRRLVPGMDSFAEWRRPGSLVVTALGPLGHVYAPRPLQPEEHAALGRALARDAHVPLVLAPEGPRAARAWTRQGEFQLPADAARVLGADHPYLEQVAADLVELCHHPNAGEFVISGWRLDAKPLSFPHENGAHAGPGPRETDAFLLAPGDLPLPRRTGGLLRPLDLRDAALVTLGRAAPVPRAIRPRPDTSQKTLRIMTYNVHSCVGTDGRLSPERIARVIARHDPDVVALQELDVERARTGGVDQAAVIARDLEMLLHFHPTVSLEEERFGDAILSRHPMRLVRAGPLPRVDGRRDTEPRGAIWVEIELGGHAFQVINTHLSLFPREQLLQAEALVGPDWLGHPDCGGTRILCGDLNALSRFPACRRIAALLRDCQLGHDDHRPKPTFFSRYPLGRIDHIFVEPDLEVVSVDVPATTLARTASDHLPLVAEIAVPPISGQRDG